MKPKTPRASLPFAWYFVCVVFLENALSMMLNRVIPLAIGALWLPAAIAAGTEANAPANASGVMPGDDALTCDQIYAQGMAQTQRDQQERSQRNEQMRAQRGATAAMMTGAMMAGGLGGTGQAAQMAAEAQADKQMALLGAPQSNPRMDHLKQLWAQKHCVKK